jgi:heme exporter protein C
MMTAGMMALFAALHLKAMRNEILRRRVRALQVFEAEATSGLIPRPAG